VTSFPALERPPLLEPGLVGQKQFLKREARGGREPAPFADRNQDRRFRPTFRDNLRPISLAGVEQLAEMRLRVVNRPSLHGNLYMTICMTSRLIPQV